jgi:serine/threonine protein kinase
LAARNVLLSYDLNAKVADFGLSSRIYHKRTEGNQRSGANQDTFPFRWSAYEMLRTGVAILEKSDVWSFGIFMWEIFYLGAAMPYAGISALPELLTFLETSQRLDKPPLCPQSLYNLILSCWDQLYHFRPTFSEIQQELTDFQTSHQQSMPQISSQQLNQRDVGQEISFDQGYLDYECSTVQVHHPENENSNQEYLDKEIQQVMMANPTYI